MTPVRARRLGLSVALLERGRHPRFAIGESSTPLANLLLEEIADEFELPALRPFSKWGSWQREHPEVGCGLKRGFTFYQHELGRPFPSEPAAALARQLLVDASPNCSLSSDTPPTIHPRPSRSSGGTAPANRTVSPLVFR